MKWKDPNDGNLVEIFSKKKRINLSSPPETCNRFKRLAHGTCFAEAIEMKIGYYERDYKFTSTNCSEFYESVHEVERILKNYGPYISSLIIHRNDAAVNDLIAKYCDGGVLRRLEIFTLKCTADLKVKFTSIYQRLLVLTIRECSVYLGVTVQQFNCDSLIELNIVNVNNCSSILENTFPKLERLTFKQTGSDGRSFTHDWHRSDGRETLLAFIGRHTTLKTLDLDINFEYRMQSLVHSVIKCKDLKELTLRKFYSSEIRLDCSELKALTKLSMLDIDIGDVGDYCHLISFLNVFRGIEILKISTGEMFLNKDGGLLNALLKLHNLRQLNLTNCHLESANWPKLNPLRWLRFTNYSDPYYSTHILSIIKRLKNLEELQIDGKGEMFTLSERDYTKIAKIADGPSALTLKCRFNFSENFLENCNKNRKVKLIKLN